MRSTISRASWKIVPKRLKIWWERQRMIFLLLNNLVLTIKMFKIKLKKVHKAREMIFYQQFSVRKLQRRNPKIQFIFKRNARDWTYQLTRRTLMNFWTKNKTTKTASSRTRTGRCLTVQKAIHKNIYVPQHQTSQAQNNLTRFLLAFQSSNSQSSLKT